MTPDEMNKEQTIEALKEQGAYMSTVHNDNFSQSLMERAIYFLKLKGEEND